jgi:hypothetical protein
MKIIVAILSDIHLTDSPSHNFAQRIDKIASAIGSTEVAPDAIMVLLGGDLANKGLPSEYAAMTTLLTKLKAAFVQRFKDVKQFYAAVPGNHDLFHPKDSEGYRANLIDGSLATISEPKPNSIYIEKLLEPQKPYYDFANGLDVPLTSESEKVAKLVDIPIGNSSIRLNLINTALLSQRDEQQGKLLLPILMLRNLIEEKAVPSLSITLMHHPLIWIESNVGVELRELLGRTSDYVLTGHQHFSSGYEQISELGPNIKYYESPALYDPQRPTSSAFRVLVFDLDNGREKQFLFRWKDHQYLPDTKRETASDWSTIVANRVLRPSLAMNSTWLKSMNDPGFAYVQREGARAGLSDLFVYPNLRERASGTSTKTKDIKGRDAFDFLITPGVTILQGGPFAGKTSLSKKLALDVRGLTGTVPIWIDGKCLTATTVEDFETFIHHTFGQQYVPSSLQTYLQLLPSQRFIIIDDWHLANVSPSLSVPIYEWLKKFASTSVLLVDLVYQVKEVLAFTRSDELFGTDSDTAPRLAFIGPINSSAKASLIQKWLISRSGRDILDVSESSDSMRVENLVRSLLGKDSLPAYPFYILCILQALESNKTAALAGGSFGPLFEVLIISSLEKENSKDLDISLRLVFLQEIAFDMWRRRTDSISREGVENVADAYLKKSLYKLPVTEFLQDAADAKMLVDSDKNFSFLYPHYFYYLVARYIRDHIDDEDSSVFRVMVDEMIDKISSTENSTIIMFLIYFERDKHRIIDRLTKNAEAIFGSTDPAKLEQDALPFSQIQLVIRPLAIEESANIAQNRLQINARLDDTNLSNEQHEPTVAAQPHEGYSYDESLPDIQKLHLSQQTIAALGQVIRNFSANLEGPRKIQVLKQTYLLGLRSLGKIMANLNGIIENLKNLDDVPEGNISISEIRIKLNQLIIAVAQLYAVFMFENVSNNIGVLNMEMAYTATMKELTPTVGIRLIDVTVRMHHFETFPETEIRSLHSNIKSNSFLLGILQWLVGAYLYTHRVSDKTQKSMAQLFKFDRSSLNSGDKV